MKVILSRHADFNHSGMEIEFTDDDLRKEHERWDDLSLSDKVTFMERAGMKELIKHDLLENVITGPEAKAQLIRWGVIKGDTGGSNTSTPTGSPAAT